MKKIVFSLLPLCISLLLTGCLETTEEVTLQEDGSGLLSTTSDMGTLLDLAKNMGGGEELKKAGDKAMDTTFSLGNQAEEMTDLSAEEKELLKKGSMNMKFNLKNNEFKTRLDFPFHNPAEIAAFNRLSGKLISTALKNQVGSQDMGGMGMEMPPFSSFNDYYTLEFENGELKRKLNKEKYASVSGDEYLNSLKQAAAMGIPVSTTYVYNLPRPAEKAEGKNVQLSEDRKKVTVKAMLDDFFDEPEKLEFKIKY